jgi:hypothetical protein
LSNFLYQTQIDAKDGIQNSNLSKNKVILVGERYKMDMHKERQKDLNNNEFFDKYNKE